MTLVALLDTETSSLDPKTGHLVEIAVATFHVTRASIVKCYSTIVRAPSNDAEKVNRIPLALVTGEDARPRDEAVKVVASLVQGCAAIVAHNASFDRAWLPELHHKPWICSCDDIEWPNAGTSRSLTSLCLDHGVGVSSAHRAMRDVLNMASLFERVAEKHDLEPMLERAMRPKSLYEVAARNFDEERNAQAKAAGFRWDSASKSWRRKMAEDDTRALPFEVRAVLA